MQLPTLTPVPALSSTADSFLTNTVSQINIQTHNPNPLLKGLITGSMFPMWVKGIFLFWVLVLIVLAILHRKTAAKDIEEIEDPREEETLI